MRQVADDLRKFAQAAQTHFRQQNGKQRKEGKQQHILHQADDERVEQNVLHQGGAEHHLKVFESRPRPGAAAAEVIESQPHVPDGNHPEDDKVDQRRQKQRIKHPVQPQAAQAGLQARGVGALHSAFLLLVHGMSISISGACCCAPYTSRSPTVPEGTSRK